HAAKPIAAPENKGPATGPRCETIYAGRPGEELADYAFRYNTDGSVRETVVYYYGTDLRAAGAHLGDALVREAAYQGKVNPLRLSGPRKLATPFCLGRPRLELRDRRVDYHPDGSAAQTVIFYYEGDVRAKDAPSSASLRRQVAFDGVASA